jgi:hypothetical protein
MTMPNCYRDLSIGINGPPNKPLQAIDFAGG